MQISALLASFSLIASAAATSSLIQRDENPMDKDPLAFLQSLGANGTDISSVVVSSTDSSSIADTVQQIDQTGGVSSTQAPNQPPSETFVTATDGDVVANSTSNSRRSLSAESWMPRYNKGNVAQRAASNLNTGYTQVFGPATGSKDASIQGIAYLTYKLVSNATYNVNDCLAFCDQVAGCQFANLYYEFNNPLYDWVFSEKSNLACALYGDVHTASEKTNFGGQQLKPSPEPLTRITQSSGFAKKNLVSPSTPTGYSYSFGPLSAANEANFYMGYSFLSTYDVQACADLCNARPADPDFGACQAFNIWRAVVSNIPTTYTCSFYGAPIDSSTATNRGQGDLKVTWSRGYVRNQLLKNGGFEGDAGKDWIFAGGKSKATGKNLVGYYTNEPHYSHAAGDGYAFLGDSLLTGSIKSKNPLNTVKGSTYILQLWYRTYRTPSLISIRMNGVTIGQDMVNSPEVKFWQLKTFTLPPAQGNDIIEIYGGSGPDFEFLDDLAVFLK